MSKFHMNTNNNITPAYPLIMPFCNSSPVSGNSLQPHIICLISLIPKYVLINPPMAINLHHLTMNQVLKRIPLLSKSKEMV